jgi:hypothetical protein
MTTITYGYAPLEAEPHQIRILTLLPGFWDDEIHCQLHKAVLAENPKYETLSYAWGNALDKKKIHLDGHAVSVTSNLELALRYLRRPSEGRLLWVDALCIDQNSQNEKSHQVGLMGSVYKQCSRVNIFLGHKELYTANPKEHKWTLARMLSSASVAYKILGSSPNLGMNTPTRQEGVANAYSHADDLSGSNDGEDIDPFDLVHHFHQDKHLYDLSCFSRTFITGALRFTATAEFLEQWNGLRRLLACPWWSRFWCVQEALLPERAIVIYGHWRIPWKTVQIAIQNHIRHLTTCCSEAEKLMGAPYYFEPDRLLIKADTIPGSSTVYDVDQIHNLEMLLREYRYKDCKDPRDKVYGILGVVKESTLGHLRPDYSLDTRIVYTSAMHAIISQHAGTDGLRFLTGEGFNSSSHDLPSWVRDFSHQPDITVLRHESNRMQAYGQYRCSQDLSHPPFIESGLYLHLKGVQIDTVTKVGPSLNSMDWRNIGSVFESWQQLAGLPLLRFPWANKRQQSFWRTLLADTIFDVENKCFRRCTAQDIREANRWLIHLLVMYIIGFQPPIEDRFVLAVLAATYGRAMFVTARGRFGLSYTTLEEGDEVWALQGGSVPFVLRNREGTRDGFRALIGDCYLDGVMDGEAFTPTCEIRRVILS